jgi:acetyl esterase
MKSIRWFFAACLVAVASWSLLLAAEPKKEEGAAKEKPATNDRLQQLLKRFPKADANGDGVLTAKEAQDYKTNVLDKQQPGQAGRTRPALQAPTQADVSYGPHPRNVLDFYQAKSDKPTPLIIFIHGGGFVGGDKRQLNPQMLEAALADGISFAALHYRFIDGKDVLLPTPQRDTARAVQFLRSKAKEWNIDSTRVACFGGSAGAGCSMWIGFHDDLADPNSSDPVQRQSTRITAIGTMGGQSTYDPIEIKKLIGGRAWEHPSIFKAYGLAGPEEALNPTPEQKKLYDDASSIAHLTKDDPPLYMIYNEADGPLPENARPGQGIHHPNFGRQLKAEMDELGIENVFVNMSDPNAEKPAIDMYGFFKKHFGM